MHTDYSAITEQAGSRLNAEQMERFLQRYAAAAVLTQGRTLEVACGAAIGLGALHAAGRAVVGLDYTPAVLHAAQGHYGGALPLLCADGEQLPLASAGSPWGQNGGPDRGFDRGPDRGFDAVVCLEAIYYMPDPQAFLAEAWRVLRPGGRLLVGSSNPDWPQFVPGELALRYPTAPELAEWLAGAGFCCVQVYGGFPLDAEPPRLAAALWLRRLLLASPLRPLVAPLAGHLKRLVYGELAPLPAELPYATLREAAAAVAADAAASAAEAAAGDAEAAARHALALLPPGRADRVHRVIYAVGEKGTG